MANGDFEGVLLIDKPSGMTSHDVVDRVRRKLKMKRVGHAGTLDPSATGLMIVLVGKATKLSQFLMGLDKVYEGVIRFGQATTTQDADGEVVSEQEVPDLSEEMLQGYLKSFLGDQYQTPPMFSAKKVDGVPLYKLARKGKEIEREPRVIRVIEFTLDSWNRPDAEVTVACSKGTYVRTLAHDLGEKVGCGAHLKDLRRVEIDKFVIEDSLELADFEALEPSEIRRYLIPPYQAVPSHVL
ncbi:MAG: tRNA pseudouridine(55) synthase TruB [Verrucomicrobiota bacterium JB022]|nr:tRNA pseudouridine(55) synthase TruB [Verrucomicrobiota bacterium JB022]